MGISKQRYVWVLHYDRGGTKKQKVKQRGEVEVRTRAGPHPFLKTQFDKNFGWQFVLDSGLFKFP
mgnify:CR=1